MNLASIFTNPSAMRKRLILIMILTLSSQYFYAYNYSKTNSIEYDTIEIQKLIKKGFDLCADNYSKSLYYIDKAEKMSKQIGYQQGLGDCNYIRSWVYYYRNDYKISLEYLEKAKEIYSKLGSNAGMAKYYLGLGRLENLYGHYLKAVKAYQKALKYEDRNKNKKAISNLFNLLAAVNLDSKNPKIALKYATKALEIKYKLGDKKEISNSLALLGEIYIKLDSLIIAEDYFLKSLKLREGLKDNRRIASSLHSLANVYNLKKEPAKAIKELQKALTLFRNLDEKTGEAICLLELNKSYLLLRQPQNSEKSINKAMEISKITENKKILEDCYRQYSIVYSQMNNYKKAFDYFKKYSEIKDSLESAEKIKEFNALEIKFQSERKDSKIKLLQNKTEIQKKNIIILVLFVIALIALSILLFYFYKLKSHKLLTQKKLFENEQLIQKQQLKIKENETQLLKGKLESKNRELTSKVLNMLMINKMLDDIVGKLNNLNKTLHNSAVSKKEILKIIREIENHSGEELWDDFNKVFQGVHADFYQKLLDLNPNLSSAEIKMASLLRLNLSTKEIAAITFKSESSIKTTRYRLRKKLNIQAHKSLVSFMMKL